MSIWKSAAGYRSEVDGQTIQPMTWLIAIVRNKALDAFRARARRKESELPESGDVDEEDSESSAAPAPSAMQLLEQATEALHAAGCMNALEGSHRQAWRWPTAGPVAQRGGRADGRAAGFGESLDTARPGETQGLPGRSRGGGMRYTHPELLEHLASAYVLGTLAGGARRRFERLQRDRADVRVRVRQWEARLGQLAMSVPAHQPSPRCGPAIAARTPAGTRHAPQGKPLGWLGWL